MVAMGRVECKWDGRAVCGIKLIFVKHFESMGRNSGPVRDPIFLEVLPGITEKPAADIRGGEAGVVKLEGILQRQVGMREDFVDDNVRERQIIALGRGSRRGETDEVR